MEMGFCRKVEHMWGDLQATTLNFILKLRQLISEWETLGSSRSWENNAAKPEK